MPRTALALLALTLGLTADVRAEDVTLYGQHPALPVEAGGVRGDALASYAIPAQRFAIRLGTPTGGRTFTKREASFPSPLQERWPEIHGIYYAPRGLQPGQQVPAAVVVHHLGGSFEAERVLAQHLAQNGVAAFAISLPNYGERREDGTKQGFLRPDDPVNSFLGFRQAALDVIRATDFLRAMPEVDPKRVGAVGVSLGAIVTALARGVDSRMGKTVLVIGGGDIETLLRESSEVPEGALERALAEQEMPIEVMREAMRPIDPLTFAARVDRDDVLMINARRDESIPERSTLKLWEALDRPRIVWFNCGHYGIVLHMLSVMNLSLDHLGSE